MDEKKAKNSLKEAKESWKAGMFCRSIWKSNGLEYEGLIKSIDMHDDQQYAFVQYLGKDLLRYGRNISPNLIL